MNVCKLCGIENDDVRIGLVEWRKPTNGHRFDAVLRCMDRTACRTRAKQAKSA